MFEFVRAAFALLILFLTSCFSFLSLFVQAVVEIVKYAVSNPHKASEKKVMEKMEACSSYSEWKEAAQELDMLQGKEVWKQECKECSFFDDQHLLHRLARLREFTKLNDVESMVLSLRAGLHRHLAGMTNPELYTQCNVGTKYLIEDYVSAVVEQLQYICNTHFPHFTDEQKFTVFHETRQAFGRTAMMFSGGAGLGMYHLGVLKALHDEGLLPTVLCGSSVGSIVAAVVAVRRDDEMAPVFRGELHLDAFRPMEQSSSLRRKLWRFLRHGVLMDINKLQDCLRANIGDITFEEAYRRTGRVLNISVSSTDKFEMPRLLNYLTAPRVLIWSAACASCAVPGLYAAVELLCKDRNNDLIPYHMYGLKWNDGSIKSDLPMERLMELFNVNYFIVSQVNPHVLPFISSTSRPSSRSLRSKLASLFLSEISHRLLQLASVGLLPRYLAWVQGVLDQKYQGDITICPNWTLKDYRYVVSNPTVDRLMECQRVGMLATYPSLAAIRNNTLIEITLNKCVQTLRERLGLADHRLTQSAVLRTNPYPNHNSRSSSSISSSVSTLLGGSDRSRLPFSREDNPTMSGSMVSSRSAPTAAAAAAVVEPTNEQQQQQQQRRRSRSREEIAVSAVRPRSLSAGQAIQS